MLLDRQVKNAYVPLGNNSVSTSIEMNSVFDKPFCTLQIEYITNLLHPILHYRGKQSHYMRK